ncbi:MAG: hypothetical protein IJD58_08645 [Lachnospiraceae bacterium]|nr:hypothetical protein [Lachnospiraceae bacterium]
MNKENILLLHIGSPKTGSTALQKFFCDNREKLAEKGWRYPRLKERFYYYETTDIDKNKNGNLLFLQDGCVLGEGEQWRNVWKAIKEELACGNVILSSEEMFEIETDKLLQYVKGEYNNVKVIVYLRCQDDYIEACWKHSIKVGVCSDNIQEWNQKMYSREHNIKMIHYYDKLKDIERIIGKENLIVRPYEKEQFEGEWKNIASDFLKYIGITELTGFNEVHKENISYEGAVLETKRIINCNYGNISPFDKVYIDTNLFVRRAMEKNMNTEHSQKYSYLTKEERMKIANTFDKENKQIAQEFLCRSDGILFYNNEKTYDEYVVDYKQLFDFSIKMLGSMIIEHNKRIIVENTSFRLMELKLQVISSGRDIVLYGAGERCRWLLYNTKIIGFKIVDNDLHKQGKLLDEIIIGKPEEYIDKNKYVIIVTCRQSGEIEQQLKSYGLVDGQDFILMSDYIY